MHIHRISVAKYPYPIRIRENCGYPQNIYPRIHIRASLITRRHRLRQNRCVFSAQWNCPRDRSRWRRLFGRLFDSYIVLRFMDSQSEFAL